MRSRATRSSPWRPGSDTPPGRPARGARAPSPAFPGRMTGDRARKSPQGACGCDLRRADLAPPQRPLGGGARVALESGEPESPLQGDHLPTGRNGDDLGDRGPVAVEAFQS